MNTKLPLYLKSHTGKMVRIVATFLEAEVDVANAYMAANPGTSLLAIDSGIAYLAMSSDLGIAPEKMEALPEPAPPKVGLDEYASEKAAAAVREIVFEALQKGWTVTVFDGCEATVRRSTQAGEIIPALATTDADTLRFFKGDEKVGYLTCIWQNGDEFIHDWADEIRDLVMPIAAKHIPDWYSDLL